MVPPAEDVPRAEEEKMVQGEAEGGKDTEGGISCKVLFRLYNFKRKGKLK